MNRDLDKLRAWKRRSKALNPVSSRRARENKLRAPILAAIRGTPCQAALTGCTGRAEHGHEVLTRARGGSITDPANIRALCAPCHRWITEHPTEAHAMGMMKHSWESPEEKR